MPNTPFHIGSISSGTQRAEDLIPAFAAVLDPSSELVARAKACDPHTAGADEVSQLLKDLKNALSALAPDYCYFGPSWGDDTNFGFWADYKALRKGVASGKLRRVADLSEIPANYNGQVIMFDDDSKLTLYNVNGGVPTKIWS